MPFTKKTNRRFNVVHGPLSIEDAYELENPETGEKSTIVCIPSEVLRRYGIETHVTRGNLLSTSFRLPHINDGSTIEPYEKIELQIQQSIESTTSATCPQCQNLEAVGYDDHLTCVLCGYIFTRNESEGYEVAISDLPKKAVDIVSGQQIIVVKEGNDVKIALRDEVGKYSLLVLTEEQVKQLHE